MARGLSAGLPAHRADRQPRSRASEPLGDVDPAPVAGQADALHGRLRSLRGSAAGEAAARSQAQEEAGRRAAPHRGVHRALQGEGVEGHASAKPDEGARAHATDRSAGRGPARAVLLSQSAEGLREPTHPARERGGRLQRRHARAERPEPAARCRRPHRPARGQRQRQEHLRKAAGGPAQTDGRHALRLREDRRRLFRAASARRPAGAEDALPAYGRPDARGHGSATAHAARHARLRRRQGGHEGGEPVGWREGAAAVRARHVLGPASSDPRRADQPSRCRQSRSADARDQRIRGGRRADQPRPASHRSLCRPALARAQRHREVLRRRHGPIPRTVPCGARRARSDERARQGAGRGGPDLAAGGAAAGGRISRAARPAEEERDEGGSRDRKIGQTHRHHRDGTCRRRALYETAREGAGAGQGTRRPDAREGGRRGALARSERGLRAGGDAGADRFGVDEPAHGICALDWIDPFLLCPWVPDICLRQIQG